MRLTPYLRSQSCILAGFLLSAASLGAGGLTVKVTPNAKACTVVNLPQWKEPTMRPGARPWDESEQCEIEFRARDGGLLAGGYCRDFGPRMYSPRKFLIDFQTGRVRPASESEWDNADPYLNFRDSPVRNGLSVKDDAPVVYAGKKFSKTGPRWWVYPQATGRISQDGSFLAVYSWGGKIEMSDDFLSRSHFDGHYYVDIYNIASGTRVLLVQGEFHGLFLDEPLEKSAWISKNLFFLPLDQNEGPTRRFVVCNARLGASSRAGE